MKQRTLARRFSVSVETIGSWERGRSEPLIRRWPGILRFLGYDPTPTGTGLPERVLGYRRKHGLTQAALGRLLALDEGTIVDLEAGKRDPSRRVTRVVIRALRSARAPARDTP